jgi:hypothetical protein
MTTTPMTTTQIAAFAQRILDAFNPGLGDLTDQMVMDALRKRLNPADRAAVNATIKARLAAALTK